ncbi:NAD(P)-binding domain-containing protein [Ornithinimicrobium sp. Y1847]|uniref:NAD(P)-binding domain-containing protein n=1 Tax=Ornithinimicrobium sp. Y1847 TaxID=3405419 RepID=UPI003B67C2B8
MTNNPAHPVRALVIGGGQAGLATSFYLRRRGVEHIVLDDQDRPGGAWLHTWNSLRLFSPAAFSSLPGWPMPPTAGEGYPHAEHVVDYLARYEQRYNIPVRRGERVTAVEAEDADYRVTTSRGTWRAAAVFNATGSWSRPFVPTYPGAEEFGGAQQHSARYRSPEPYAGQRVVVVGGGNSGAQIAADLASRAHVTWCTLHPPRFLPDHVDGRELFRVATLRARGHGEGVGGLGDIVAVPPVRATRDAGRLRRSPMFERFTTDGVVWFRRHHPTGRHGHLVHRLPARARSPRTARAAPHQRRPGHRRPDGGRRSSPCLRRLRRLVRPGLGHPDRRRPVGPTGRRPRLPP